MTTKELIQIVKNEDPKLLGSDFVSDICAMHGDKPNEDEVIEFDDSTLNLCNAIKYEKDKLFNTAKALIIEIAKFGMTCDTLASDRLHAFAQALIESKRDQYAIAGHKIEELDENGACRLKAMTYALLVIGNIYSRDAFNLKDVES